jgi:hypothetical protein
MKSKLFLYAKNVLAVLGIVALVYVIGAPAAKHFGRLLSVKTVLGTVVSADGYTKATLYQVDAGAMAALRTYVALSNVSVDGSEQGEVIATILSPGNEVLLNWKTARLLTISYPIGTEIEYAVGKTRGIVIESSPYPSTAPQPH